MQPDVSESTRREYAARMNRVLDHIQGHLGESLNLEDLARVACFSAFHFHRLFRAWMGETLQQHIQRLRLERAAHQLHHNPLKTVTDIALDCGFGGSSAFARAFREHHGVSATEWRKRKMGQMARNLGKAWAGEGLGSSSLAGVEARRQEEPMSSFPLEVAIQDLPPTPVAYVRHVGPYKGDSALFGRLFGQLCAWAGPRGLIRPEALFLSLYHDNPDITPEAKHRLEVGLSVPEGTEPSGDVGVKRLEGGAYAMARISIQPHEYEKAWQALMAEWLPSSGYQPDDRPAMEIYRNDPGSDPEGRHILDICLPVRPL